MNANIKDILKGLIPPLLYKHRPFLRSVSFSGNYSDWAEATKDSSGYDAEEIFNKISSNSNHFVYVEILDGIVVGSTTMIIEPKFIHDGGNVAHIEDVVISKEMYLSSS